MPTRPAYREPIGSASEARRALEAVGLVAGLSAVEVRHRLGRSLRLGDLSRRALAFYLLEMEDRRLYQDQGASSTVHYASSHLDLDPRRTRELIAVGRKLVALPRIDEAFCEQRIGWTQVLTLLRVASPEHEAAWLERAEGLTCQQLRREVTLAHAGQAPRPPGSTKGTPAIRFPETLHLDVLTHQLQQRALEKLSAERGRPVTASELQEVLLSIYLNMERDGDAPGWKHVSSSLYRILLRHEPVPEHGRPLFVETEDGLLPVDGSDGSGVIEKNRTACACCDGQALTEDGEPIDGPTPAPMRQRVLVRDRNRCRCCGEGGELHVHHITFRARGGRTKVWNLLVLCLLCRIRHKVHYADSRIMPRRPWSASRKSCLDEV